VIEWDAARVASEAGARLVWAGRVDASPSGPRRAVIDSRQAGPGDLFVGLPGERVDGGAYAKGALRAGAWGTLVAPDHAHALTQHAEMLDSPTLGGPGVVLAHPDPLNGLQSLARAWRRTLGRSGARVVGITGSTGKTSTKDILAAMLAGDLRTVASPQNLNTEIGLPLTILGAPADTEVLVLEMAMRGSGQIAELVTIGEPDVGVIVNVGPVHLELLGSLEAIAAAKAELIAGMAPGATVVLPAGESLLEVHRRSDLRTVTFGVGGDVELLEQRVGGEVVISDGAERLSLRPSFAQPHNLLNLLAAVAAARALGVTPEGRLEVAFSALRGERIELHDGIVLINDCYNANPMSMRAAIDDLVAHAPARRVAVLGDMLELGPEHPRLHQEIGEYAAARGVEALVTVGPLARAMRDAFQTASARGSQSYEVADAAVAAELLESLLGRGDTVLVKGSRGVGLERVAETLTSGSPVGRS
jgi:UDP-N-acetylmuramoyl-tripeptide--D-alanyl-D-alanine ligase